MFLKIFGTKVSYFTVQTNSLKIIWAILIILTEVYSVLKYRFGFSFSVLYIYLSSLLPRGQIHIGTSGF